MTGDKILTPAPHKNSCLCDHYLYGRYNLEEFFSKKWLLFIESKDDFIDKTSNDGFFSLFDFIRYFCDCLLEHLKIYLKRCKSIANP